MDDNPAKPVLVLASASPRRRDLLTQIALPPDVIDPAEVDEIPRPRELPARFAARVAQEKLDAVAPRHPGAFVLAADTVVAAGRRILPKPETEAEARRCLERLSGRRHRVHGGIAVQGPDGRRAQRLVTSIVTFKPLAPFEIDDYLTSGEWRGKAGGYAIQGLAGAFVRHLSGSYFNVVGLPLYEARNLLHGLGFPIARHAVSA